MNEKLLKIAKIVVPIVSIGVTAATSYLSDKNLDDKVSKKVADALAKKSGEES